MSRLGGQGALLFGFIPLVLFLFLQVPLGPAPSVVLGIGIMLGHRFVAAPWMRRHAEERCLWCAAEAGLDPAPVEVEARGRRLRFRVCGNDHRESADRFLSLVARFRGPIALGIFLPLLLLLAGTLFEAAGRTLISHEWNRIQFRTIVAVTVVSVSLAYPGVRRAGGPLGCPFPIHNLFLLGIRNTLWVFRTVGAWWMILTVIFLARP